MFWKNHSFLFLDFGSLHLYNISKLLGSKWKHLGASLNIDFSECESIAADNPHDNVYGAYTLLSTWRDRHSGSVAEKKTTLVKAVKNIGRMDLLPEI